MTVQTAIIQGTAPGVNGLQDITSLNFGTPKGAIFIANIAPSNGLNDNPMSISWGGADGTNQMMVCGTSRDGAGSTGTRRKGNTFEVIHLLGGPSSTDDIAVAEFDSFITNGVRLNWTTTSGDGELFTVVLFTGEDLDFDVGSYTAASGDGTTTDIDCGFVPDIFISVANGGVLDDVTDNPPNLVIGAASNKSPIAQGAVGSDSRNAQATSEVRGAYLSNRVSFRQDDGADTFNRSLELTGFISSPVEGVEVTLRAGTGSGAHSGGYIAIKTNGATDFWVGNFDTPTSTGNLANSDPGFTPQLVMLLQGVETDETPSRGTGSNAVSAFNATAELSGGYWDKDSVGTTDTGSYVDTKSALVTDEDGVVFVDASFVSMDNSGFTLNFTTVDGTARKWVGIAIGEIAAAPIPCISYGQVIMKPTGPNYGQRIGLTADTFPQYAQVRLDDPKPEYGQIFRKDPNPSYGQRITRDCPDG